MSLAPAFISITSWPTPVERFQMTSDALVPGSRCCRGCQSFEFGDAMVFIVLVLRPFSWKIFPPKFKFDGKLVLV